jgi:hypothetical protein
MRAILTDGLNSTWHILFGMMGYYYNIFSILFILYQIITETPQLDNNMPIDILEFILGYLIIFVMNKFINHSVSYNTENTYIEN